MGNTAGTSRRLPASIRRVGLAIAFVLLTLCFVYWTFPYERLRDPIAMQLHALTGANVRIGELDSHLGLLGPGLRATTIVATLPPAERQSFEYFFVRPGWSLSWLSGVPSLYLEFKGDPGAASGVLRMGDEPGWVGELEQIDLSLLPLATALAGSALTGRVDAEVDITSVGSEGPPYVGTVQFDAREGTFRLPDLPIGVPYDTLQGSLVLGGERHARVEFLSLEGPMLRARVEGNIGGGRGNSPALDLAASVQSEASPVHSVLRGYGVQTDADGNASFHIGGTAQRPAVQATQ